MARRFYFFRTVRGGVTKKSSKPKKKIINPYTSFNDLPRSLEEQLKEQQEALPADLKGWHLSVDEIFKPVDPANWENLLKQWILVWQHRYKFSKECLAKIKTLLHEYHNKRLNVFFLNVVLTDIRDSYDRMQSLRSLGTPIIKFRKHGPLLEPIRKLVEKKLKFKERAIKRRDAFLELRKQMTEYRMDQSLLLKIAQELRERELKRIGSMIQAICDADAYRRLIKAPKKKKYVDPILINEIRRLVDYFDSTEPRYRHKGAIPKVACLLDAIGISVSEKTVDRYCALAKPLSRLPFPSPPSNHLQRAEKNS